MLFKSVRHEVDKVAQQHRCTDPVPDACRGLKQHAASQRSIKQEKTRRSGHSQRQHARLLKICQGSGSPANTISPSARRKGNSAKTVLRPAMPEILKEAGHQ